MDSRCECQRSNQIDETIFCLPRQREARAVKGTFGRLGCAGSVLPTSFSPTVASFIFQMWGFGVLGLFMKTNLCYLFNCLA